MQPGLEHFSHIKLWVLLIAALTAVASSFLHLFWTAGGQWGLNRLSPQLRGRPLFRPERSSHLAVGLVHLYMGLLFVQPLIPQIPFWPSLRLSPLGLWLSAAVLALLLALRIVGDFRYVGLFSRAAPPQLKRQERLFLLPFAGLWLSACVFLMGL